MDTGAGRKEHGWSYSGRDSQEFQVDCLRITWSQSLVHRHSCFEHPRARYVIQMVWKCSCTDAWRTRRSDFAGGLSGVSCVRTKFYTSTRTSVPGHRVWMTTQSASWISVLLRPSLRNAPLSPDKTCYLVMILVKVLRERKWTCLVGALCRTIGILSTTYKVCVFLSCMLREIAQRSCRGRSPWAYF
jgi:hypothetical protein